MAWNVKCFQEILTENDRVLMMDLTSINVGVIFNARVLIVMKVNDTISGSMVLVIDGEHVEMFFDEIIKKKLAKD